MKNDCQKRNEIDLNNLEDQNTNFLCYLCLEDHLPFSNLDEHDYDNSLLNENINVSLTSLNRLNELKFNPFSLNDDQRHQLPFDENSDPDLNFYNHLIPQNQHCNYYFEDSLNQLREKNNVSKSFSVLHLNTRSFKNKYDNFNQMLENLKQKNLVR